MAGTRQLKGEEVISNVRLVLQCPRVPPLTVEVGADAAPGQQAVDGDLVDDVQQQEGRAGDAQGLQQTPGVTWSRRTASAPQTHFKAEKPTGCP